METLLKPQNMSIIALLLALSVLLTALAFQHLGGYIPCTLCYYERFAYYATIPLALAAMLFFRKDYEGIGLLILGLIALLFFANALLAGYHSGAEWKWWPGPETCAATSSLSGKASDLFESLKTIKVVRCDEASLRIFGLSFAGYNFLLSVGFGLMLCLTILRSRKHTLSA